MIFNNKRAKILATIKSVLYSKFKSLNPNDRQSLIDELQAINFKRSENLAIIIFIVDLLIMYSDRTNYVRGLWQINPAYKTLFYLHVLLAFAMLIQIILSAYTKRYPVYSILERYCGYGFGCFALFFCAIVSINDQQIHGQITVYLLGMFLVTVNNYFKPLTSFLLYFSSYFTFVLGITLLQPDFNILRGHYLNSIFLLVIAWVLSIMLFNLRTQEFINKKIIEQQKATLEEVNKGLVHTNHHLEQSLKALDESHNIILTLVLALESKDHYTYGHSQRVAEISLEIAKYLNLDEEKQTQIWRAAILHDIGKIGIPDAILNKNGPLSNDEWSIMCSHPARGENICSKLNFTQEVLPIIRSHHERFDGNGYPDKLTGNDIPFLARIIMIADTVDAITSERPYRPSRSMDDALVELAKGSGTQFDPHLVKVFLEMYEARTQ